MIRIGLLALLCSVTFGSSLAAPAPSHPTASPRAESEIDIAQLVRELQWTASDPADLSMVWLLPPVLLRTLLVQGSGLTPAAAADAMKVFEPYLVAGIVRGRFDETGAPVLEPSAVIRNSVRVIMDSGEVIHPESAPDSAAVRALAQMERTLAGTLGELGAHTTFVLFPGTTSTGRAVFPLTERTAFSVELSALGPLPPQRVAWRLPLASLVADRVCPRCGYGFNGAWTYCPWSGERLVDPNAPDVPSGPLATTPATSTPAAPPVEPESKPKPAKTKTKTSDEPKKPDMYATP